MVNENNVGWERREKQFSDTLKYRSYGERWEQILLASRQRKAQKGVTF